MVLPAYGVSFDSPLADFCVNGQGRLSCNSSGTHIFGCTYGLKDGVTDEDFKKAVIDFCGSELSSSNSSQNSASSSEKATAYITISGTVVDEKGEPLIGAAIIPEGVTGVGTTSDIDGNFTFKNFPSGHNLEISYIGYEKQILPAQENIKIVMKEDAQSLEDVVVTAKTAKQCEPKTGEKEVVKDFESQTCYVVSCASDRYELTGTKQAYRNKNLISFNQTSDVCKDTTCEMVTVGTSCEDKVGKKCDSTGTSNVANAEYVWENNQLVCKIKKCNDGYLPNDNGTACEVSEGSCSETQVATIENATAGELKKGVCYATECKGGFEPSDGKCIAISGNCDPMPENAISAHREWDSTSNTEVCIVDSCKDNYTPSSDKKACVSTLSEEDSKAKIAELQENADAMKAKEQSTANKLLGGAAIGAMGIGGMQLASAAAEQKADAAAEDDMAAYIATFKCDYGQGMNIKGGEANITLPGANVLLPLYNEYTALAADLKTRKEALEMAPGIESEVILDAATSGLYDNESIGIDGAYTSLSRALMDENSADAAAWAAQKSETASQLKTGAIVAGAGALVGIVGDILINDVADKRKESSDEIIAKYDALRRTMKQDLQSVEKQSEQEATSNAPATEEGKNANAQDETKVEEKKESVVGTVLSTIGGKDTESGNTDTGITEVISAVTGNTEEKVEEKNTPTPIVTIYNESMFDSGKTEIKTPTTKLDEVINTLKTQIGSETVFEIVLVAHTDKDKIIQTSNLCKVNKVCTNEQLSAARAESVKAYITSKWPDMPSTAKITTLPVGSACAKGTTKAAKALDRKVDFYVFFAGEDLSSINTCKTSE